MHFLVDDRCIGFVFAKLIDADRTFYIAGCYKRIGIALECIVRDINFTVINKQTRFSGTCNFIFVYRDQIFVITRI